MVERRGRRRGKLLDDRKDRRGYCHLKEEALGRTVQRARFGIKARGRCGRRRMKLLDDLKERRGYSYLKEKALDRTVWRTRFARGFGPVDY